MQIDQNLVGTPSTSGVKASENKKNKSNIIEQIERDDFHTIGDEVEVMANGEEELDYEDDNGGQWGQPIPSYKCTG